MDERVIPHRYLKSIVGSGGCRTRDKHPPTSDVPDTLCVTGLPLLYFVPCPQTVSHPHSRCSLVCPGTHGLSIDKQPSRSFRSIVSMVNSTRKCPPFLKVPLFPPHFLVEPILTLTSTLVPLHAYTTKALPQDASLTPIPLC